MKVTAPRQPSKRKPPSPRAEERAADLERRRELGQFFTPQPVAEFMWDVLEALHGGAFPSHASLIDPACGDGVFLRVARERGRLDPAGLFGTDIDPALESGWHADPVLRSAQLHQVNGLLDAPGFGIQERSFDVVAGNPPFSGKGLRELLRLLEEDREANRDEERDLFGLPVPGQSRGHTGQPLSRSERADLDKLARRLCEYACWRMNAAPDDDTATAAPPDNDTPDLLAGLALNDRPRPTVSDCERSAHLIRQWPAGRLLDVSRPEIREVIGRLASTAVEVFFTERFLRLAKPGGLIAVIVPESIAASERLSPLRRWLTGRMDLLMVVGLPQRVFTGVGANARTTILFARRRLQERPEGWWLQPQETLPDAGRSVRLTAPQVEAPNWSLQAYLDGVLQSVRAKQASARPTAK